MRTFLLLLISCSLTFSQDIIISGKIIDSVTGQPVYDAVIHIPPGFFTSTNSDGEFKIKIPAAPSQIRISHLNYKTFYQDLDAFEGLNDLSVHIEPSTIKLDEVVVNIERFEKYLKDSPYSVVLTDYHKLNSSNFNSLSDALNSEPGISSIKDGIWGTDISIRGLSRNNVVTLIDGTRIETANDISARLSMIDLNDIERVEVIKGASSSLYGTGATGGIVNIVSKSPRFSTNYSISGNISTGYSSVNNLKTVAGSIFNSGLMWSLKISGSYRIADDIQTPAGVLKNSNFSDYSLSGILKLQPRSNHIFNMNYQLFKAQDVGIPGAAPLFPAGADVRYPDEKRELISAGYEIQNYSRVLSKIIFRYSHQLISRNVENIPNIVQIIPASGNSAPRRISVLKISPMADHTSHNFSAQANLILSQSNLLSFGIDYWSRQYEGERLRYQLIETLDSAGHLVVNTLNKIISEKPLPDSKFQSFGFFIQDDEEIITDRLRLSIGARIDKINVYGETTSNPVYEINNGTINTSPPNQRVIWPETETDDISYSSNIGLKYSVTRRFDLTTSLGYAFRSPSLEERFQYIDLGNIIRVGDPELKPEKGYSADFGFRFYSDRLKVISTLFFNYISDIVVEKPGVYEGRSAQIKTNIGEARLYGFDFLINFNFLNRWLAYLTSSYVKGDDLTADGDLPQIPPLNGTIGIKADIMKQLSAEISSSIFKSQNDVASGEIPTPGYAVFNVSLYIRDIRLSVLNFQFSAGIENIFDKSYRSHLSTTRGGITVEPGRNYYLRLITNW